MSEFSNFKYSGKDELEILESSLENYNQFIVSSFIAHASPAAKKILDFGAGIGTLSKIWIKLSPNSEISCLEIDKTQRAILNSRGFTTLKNLPNSFLFDYIFTSNVLEHIEDDVETLIKLFNIVELGGAWNLCTCK